MPAGAIAGGLGLVGSMVGANASKSAAKTGAQASASASQATLQAQREAIAAQQAAQQQNQQILDPFVQMGLQFMPQMQELINQQFPNTQLPQFNPSGVNLPQFGGNTQLQQFNPSVTSLPTFNQQTTLPTFNPTSGVADIQALTASQNPFYSNMDPSTLPGYEFIKKEIEEATQNSFAARGLGSSPVAVEALQNRVGDLANTYWQDLAGVDMNRRNQQLNEILSSSGLNIDEFMAGLQGGVAQSETGINEFSTNLQSKLAQAGLDMETFQTMMGRDVTQAELGMSEHGTKLQDQLAAAGLNMDEYMALLQGQLSQGNLDLAGRSQGYDEILNMINIGANAAAGQGSGALGTGRNLADISMSTGDNLGNLLINAGNANAAGQVGSAQAWQQGLGSLGDLAMIWGMGGFGGGKTGGGSSLFGKAPVGSGSTGVSFFPNWPGE